LPPDDDVEGETPLPPAGEARTTSPTFDTQCKAVDVRRDAPKAPPIGCGRGHCMKGSDAARGIPPLQRAVRSFSTHGHQSAAKGSSTTVSRS
jgi:hypothetical protein